MCSNQVAANHEETGEVSEQEEKSVKLILKGQVKVDKGECYSR